MLRKDSFGKAIDDEFRHDSADIDLKTIVGWG